MLEKRWIALAIGLLLVGGLAGDAMAQKVATSTVTASSQSLIIVQEQVVSVAPQAARATPVRNAVAAVRHTAGAVGHAVSNLVSGPDDALAEVNAERARRGLRPFLPDPGLNAAARACAQRRAAMRRHGHLPNDFAFVPPGTVARSTGCGAWPQGAGWGTCCTYENFTYAGAAYAIGSDGLRYMHLVVR